MCGTLLLVIFRKFVFTYKIVFDLFQPSPKFLMYPVLLRVIFIPMFLVCNYLPEKIDRVMPILIMNDWVYWIAAIALGLTSGYFSSVAMMYCPR